MKREEGGTSWRECGDGVPSVKPEPAARTSLDPWLPERHTLNREHFGADLVIPRALNALVAAVQETDTHVAWSCFLALAEEPGDNVGSWAIWWRLGRSCQRFQD